MKIQSISDIITNSSSELFVFQDGLSIEQVITQLDKIYPGWTREYSNPVAIEDIDNDMLYEYLQYAKLGYDLPGIETEWYRTHNYGTKYTTPTFDMFNKDNCYARNLADTLGDTPENIYENWSRYNPFIRSYCDKDYDNYLILSDNGCELYKKKFGKTILMRSNGTNPSWGWQQKLECIADRVHLG